MINLIKRLLSILGNNKDKIYLAFFFSFIKLLFSKAPIIIAFITINRFYNGVMTLNSCLWFGLIILLCLLIQFIMGILMDKYQSALAYTIFAEKRIELGEHLRRMPMGYFTEGNIGKISSVLSTDMTFVEGYCMNELGTIMSHIFAEFIMIIFLLFLNIWLGLIAIIFLVLIYGVSKYMQKDAMKDSEIRQEQNEELSEAVLEFIQGIGIIKSYNILGEKSKDLTQNFTKSCKYSLDFENNHSIWQRRLLMIYGIGTTVIIASSLYLNFLGYMNNMYVVGILLVSFDIFAPVKALLSSTALFTIMNSCMDRIDSVFNEVELPDKGTQDIPEVSDEFEIEFKDVCFGYEEQEILHNISFNLPQNTMSALVGPSGGGKSTIANLLARFWDVQGGQVLIRGIDIRKVPVSELMNHISMVFQNVYLFNDTIYNNISMGRPDATREDVIEAAKKARCYDFITALPKGFETIVKEGGISLSGGEKQRIAIARCILKDTPIVILDEATASVDVDNESYIQDAISELCQGKTLLVIAHRLHTIRNADEILVIANGMIKEQGTHDELIDKNKIYCSLVNVRSNNQGWN